MALEPWEQFINLFGGLEHVRNVGAYGTGKGMWIKRPLESGDVIRHLTGQNDGIGIGPLNPDSECMFAAIDLDEPDFEAALEMQSYIPGQSFIERSRSGNAHIWVFFREPIEAWVPMGILKEATVAAGKTGVEVFPKNHDWERVQYGNYINLPYHGDERPVVHGGYEPISFRAFLRVAYENLNDPSEWRKRAKWLMIDPPGERKISAEFGTQRELHRCAEYIIAHAEDNPVTVGHRAAVFFSLAKMLANCEMFDSEESLEMMRSVNDCSPDPIPSSELGRILGNAERGQFTSTGCDDPLVIPFADPQCPIIQGSI